MRALQEGISRPQAISHYSPIAELRRYTLHPGRRDELITLFDRHFLESQESCGMKIIGQFRDLDDPDAFVWLRGFEDMRARHNALTAFYDGPVWGEHRNAANATMIDSDDVLLLHPVGEADGFEVPARRPAQSATDLSPAIIQAVTYKLKSPAESGFLVFYEETLVPILRNAGESRIALFASEHSDNTFTRLPVRLGENVAVAFSRFDNVEAHTVFARTLANNPAWPATQEQVSRYLIARPTIVRLAPTARSLLRECGLQTYRVISMVCICRLNTRLLNASARRTASPDRAWAWSSAYDS